MKPQKNGRFDSICPICYVPGHLISQGTADILLDACADLWTGSDLEPLTDDVTTILIYLDVKGVGDFTRNRMQTAARIQVQNPPCFFPFKFRTWKSPDFECVWN